jgi:hypothetical protein
MDEKFLGLPCEKDGCCHCHGVKNCLLFYHVIIHKNSFLGKSFDVDDKFVVKSGESLGTSIMSVVLLLYEGEWCKLWRQHNYK